MRALIQRVNNASVSINECIHSQIGKGFLILLGVEESDKEEDIDWLCGKIARLRIFSDSSGLMNLSLNDINAECMVVSQFTLFASTKKGNRPSFSRAAKAEISKPLYELFVKKMSEFTSKKVSTGLFGENMQISLVNDGPVTILIDTRNRE